MTELISLIDRHPQEAFILAIAVCITIVATVRAFASAFHKKR